MADPGFPSQHTTTTTVTNTEMISNLRFDTAYISTLPGQLKIAQIVSVSLKKDVGFFNYITGNQCFETSEKCHIYNNLNCWILDYVN